MGEKGSKLVLSLNVQLSLLGMLLVKHIRHKSLFSRTPTKGQELQVLLRDLNGWGHDGLQ